MVVQLISRGLHPIAVPRLGPGIAETYTVEELAVTVGQVIPPVLTAHEVAELLRQHPAIRLLDVRTPGEFEAMHIRGAYNVPLDLLGEHGAEIRAAVADPVVLICQSGQRARRAEETLRAAGMPNLHVLEGGMNGWLAAGQPVVRGTPRLSLERQVRIAAGTLAAAGGILALTVSGVFALVPSVIGIGLVFAGLTGRCGMALVLARLPYNRPRTCDVGAMVRALTSGAPAEPGGISVSPRPIGDCAAC
jgi:rhodanese-related sulfurtransferase